MPRNHTCCSLFASAHQPRELRKPLPQPVLLLDATLNIQVHVCGIPGCRRLLQKGEAPPGRLAGWLAAVTLPTCLLPSPVVKLLFEIGSSAHTCMSAACCVYAWLASHFEEGS
jgi:hypothetical protein